MRSRPFSFLMIVSASWMDLMKVGLGREKNEARAAPSWIREGVGGEREVLGGGRV